MTQRHHAAPEITCEQLSTKQGTVGTEPRVLATIPVPPGCAVIVDAIVSWWLTGGPTPTRLGGNRVSARFVNDGDATGVRQVGCTETEFEHKGMRWKTRDDGLRVWEFLSLPEMTPVSAQSQPGDADYPIHCGIVAVPGRPKVQVLATPSPALAAGATWLCSGRVLTCECAVKQQ